MTAPLTAAQVRVLRELAAGNEAQHMPYMGRMCKNPYWYFYSMKGKFTQQMKKLIQLKYAKEKYSHIGSTATITDAGRAYLAALDAAEEQRA